MLLSDRDILAAMEHEAIDIDPFDHSCLNPASVDLRLHHLYRRPDWKARQIDVSNVPANHTQLVDSTEPMLQEEIGRICIKPGEFLLMSTAEVVTLGPLFAARVEGKSSLARLGLAVHVTGGFIDPGFAGHVTLEVANLAQWEITLHAGMKIAQIAFHALSSAPLNDYTVTGRYSGQVGPTESRYTLS